jgi:hypothetical protein
MLISHALGPPPKGLVAAGASPVLFWRRHRVEFLLEGWCEGGLAGSIEG